MPLKILLSSASVAGITIIITGSSGSSLIGLPLLVAAKIAAVYFKK